MPFPAIPNGALQEIFKILQILFIDLIKLKQIKLVKLILIKKKRFHLKRLKYKRTNLNNIER